MKKNLKDYPLKGDLWPKVMKLTAILTLVFCINVSAAVHSQVLNDVHFKNIELKSLIKEIEKRTNYQFFYSPEDVNVIKGLKVDEKSISVEALLDKYLKTTDLTFEIVDETIVLKPKAIPNNSFQLASGPVKKAREMEEVRGVVQDESGEPLVGVIVQLKGTNQANITDVDGKYRVLVPDGETVLVFRLLGYESQEIQVGNQTQINVSLKVSVTGLDEVVVTGVVERSKESFTGAAATFDTDDLKQISNGNAINALRTLDPSIAVLENNELGSNPNALPNIEVRGKTSISTTDLRDEFGSDPNQPLFVLDGFETTLRTIVDLDVNRIKSITILKDAASTALYGSNAANGVVVVETKKPEVGKILLSYTGDFRVDMPDLSDYNMMNAAEKLEFERLSGRYVPFNNGAPPDPADQLELDKLYNTRLADVRRGVNSYWLSDPVQTGFTNSHTLYADGGTDELRFGVSANYRNVQGVMKGSGRETWQGAVDLVYRKGKFNISNKLFVNGSLATESPYGDFSNFVNANPYFRKYNEDGGVDKYLEDGNVQGYNRGVVVNPLYNALLDNQYDETRTFQVQNNIQLRYNITPSFRLQAMGQLVGGKEESEAFISPQNTQFDNTDFLEKGRYNNSQNSSFTYRGNIMAIYSKVRGKHSITANGRMEIQNQSDERKSFTAVGFPIGAVGNPAFAFSYLPNSNPSAAYRDFRRVNGLASVNYSYDQRFLFDATYRMDGSTTFGRNNPYSPFWAVGAGWNLHNEPSLKQNSKVSTLRLRGNIGVTGNQSFGNITSVSVYNFDAETNIFGQGIYLSTLGNPDLEWQRTQNISVGIDFGLFNNKLSGYVNAYQKITDPLIVVIDQPASTGINGFPMNIGKMDAKGIETNIRYSPIFRPSERVVWTIGWMGSFTNQKYAEFDNKLESLNNEELESNSFLRYRDGYSPTDIWAVPSLGIDPATGKEVFLKQNGESTFEYDPTDIVRVGNTRPFSEGVLSTNVSYKGWLLNVYMRYRIGADVFNEALYNKVENISRDRILLNQDKRALTERWRQPGDISQFKSISLTSTSPMSSRFVQEENSLSGESISLGYQWNANSHFLKNMGLSRLRVNAIMNDIFRLSTVQVERGTSYPFARTVSFTINATF
ncbi:SusC/RagA family TonB-linked outer membrane protein [Algoriphagus halophytocola]|uniref:SusC/RagA family TonB-linked outer membrane protein n=1 Tax=Algoriphagus halophytocola TaxID=2991499 RepID=A0ABY6MBW9_9BACT|nr:SusC/RagA family TonB-linked outer membrane protein [Algoriphagus sp. TR-M5]UZD21141.1 SusC/RagA family TonB-linked outer membrane protein [Algoriphagus sp. TR-M5]